MIQKRIDLGAIWLITRPHVKYVEQRGGRAVLLYRYQ